MGERDEGVILIEIESLRGHEQVIPENLRKRTNKIID